MMLRTLLKDLCVPDIVQEELVKELNEDDRGA